MWFRNLSLYRFKQPFAFDGQYLADLVENLRFKPAQPMENAATGWHPPLGREATELLHVCNGFTMLCQRTQTKLLPSSVVSEELAQRIALLDGPVPRRERNAIKDEIIAELMPKAFSTHRYVYGYIDPAGWLAVDAASNNQADAFCSLLRESLGSLPVARLTAKRRPSVVMTSWVQRGDADNGLSISDQCDLHSPVREGSAVKCRRQDLASAEIAGHLKAGKLVSMLALEWRERIAFSLTEGLDIRRLKFLDIVQDQAREIETEDDAQRFDADMAIMTGELHNLLADLSQAFGIE